MRWPQTIPWLIGGAADLSPSTKTRLTVRRMPATSKAADRWAIYAAATCISVCANTRCAPSVNGMALTGLRAFGSGFLIFTDYARGAIRLSSLMDLPVIHVWTHDSIGVGEDGPTHQPIEQIVSLRAIPGMVVIRPADANEMSEAYRCILQLKDRPAALICSRQPLPIVDRAQLWPQQVGSPGALMCWPTRQTASRRVILIGTGSEVALCLAARDILAAENIAARVVSMPSWELFEEQDEEYRDSVLPASITARVTVEEASTIGWHRYAGPNGDSRWACIRSACRRRSRSSWSISALRPSTWRMRRKQALGRGR